MKWFGPSEISRCCQPVYEILVANNTKWVTRDKLKQALQGVNIQVEPDQPDIATLPKEPDEVMDKDSDDSGIEVPVLRSRGSYWLRPNSATTQVLTSVHSVFARNFYS